MSKVGSLRPYNFQLEIYVFLVLIKQNSGPLTQSLITVHPLIVPPNEIPLGRFR